MRFRFQFRRYRAPFRTPVRTAHGMWTEREGVIVRLEDASEAGHRAVGFGEAAPIPWFGTETADDVEEACRALGDSVEETVMQAVSARLGCLRNALAGARRELRAGRVGRGLGERVEEGDEYDSRVRAEENPNSLKPPRPFNSTLGVAALLPAGPMALAQIPPRAEMGFRVFKWKVGVGDVADELALLDDVCAALPTGAWLRLDANGAWDRRRAEKWLERCAERPVEFVEQPCFADTSQSLAAQRRSDDLLLGLAESYPTPLALDESLVGERDIERWIAAGWPGIYVVKPSLLGDVGEAMARLERAKAAVVFSSALETAVGAKAALQAAFAWKGQADPARPTRSRAAASASSGHGGSESARPLGFGVWPLFADARFDGPAAAPFLHYDDVEKINSETIWTALA